MIGKWGLMYTNWPWTTKPEITWIGIPIVFFTIFGNWFIFSNRVDVLWCWDRVAIVLSGGGRVKGLGHRSWALFWGQVVV